MQPYLTALDSILREGLQLLEKKGTALDVAEHCVCLLENCPLFNAGCGSVLNEFGEIEMEASIMEGHTQRCGACTLIRDVKNPIKLARVVMENTKHIFLSGEKASELASKYNLEKEPKSYFVTERRMEQLKNKLQKEPNEGATKNNINLEGGNKGTVGCVVLDSFGNLAAATSTGGTTGKLAGRIGDTPLIGSGNFANEFVAVSGTGIGEQFIRNSVASTVARIVEYRPNTDLKTAADIVVHSGKFLKEGDGGVIAVSKQGEVVTSFNSVGMFRGRADSEGLFELGIWQ
eukprot:TRINITY_DN1312_c0_g1_i3.p1 TRINITY_DN1312_c0_g1~~TRINITY_DN1312_c0_g1_i3.p1  ORF type:complete len:289 (+),score=60.99 TRINITY_DN1312_c0_g1_i3:244-1110(+)